MRLRRTATALVAALPLALGLAACGGEPEATGQLPSTPVESTPAKAAQPVAHLSQATFLPAMKKSMAGKDSVRVTMKMVAGGQTMTMTGLQTMKPVAMQLEMNGAAFGGKAKMVLVKGIVYLSTPDLPTGKYIKIDPADSGDPMAASLGNLAKEMDPTKTFDAFDSGLKSVKFVRNETVDGRKVDRYAVTVDTAAALKAQRKKTVAGMPKTIVYTVWMGSTDHLMYKVFFEMAGVSLTMNASDWGKPVTIKAPPASKVVSR